MFFKKKKDVIFSPVNNGELKSLSDLGDGVFSEKMLGDGFAVVQSDGKVYAPISGELVTVFETKHAYGIKTKNGLNVLVHIGIDTVNLGGDGFISHVKQGDKVSHGDLLATVDLELLKSKNVISDVIVVVTSDSEIQPIDSSFKTNGIVSTTDEIITEFK